MISEKTVELNTTAELLAWLRYVTGITHTAIGPSQRQEAVLGYDVLFRVPALCDASTISGVAADCWWRLHGTFLPTYNRLGGTWVP